MHALKLIMIPVISLSFVLAATSAGQTQPNVNRPPAQQQQPPQGQPNVNRPPVQQQEQQKERERPQQDVETRAGADMPASFYKVSELIGLRVDARGGNRIGQIKDIAINNENGRIRYAIVDNGSGTLYPIPMPALRMANTRQRATVDTTLERMRDAPTFNPNGWNTIGDAKWGKIVFEFYGLQREPDLDRDRQNFVPGSAVVGGKVETRRGDGMGSIRDVMIDTEKNVVAYAVLQHGNNARLFALPWGSLTPQDGGKRLVVRSLTRDDLRDAPGFANSRWPSYTDLNWPREINYDTRPPTWVYGLNPTSGGGGSGGGGSGGGGDRGKLGGWQTSGRYGQFFNPRTVDRWRGTVVRTEKIEPLPNMDPGTALIVRVEGQGNMIVHLGPEWFVRRQQEAFTAGDAIEFAGSRVDINRQTVVMATRLFIEGHVMTLRNAEGVPVWDAWQERR